MQALAARERLVQAEHFDERARQYLDLKIEGIREAPVSVCVCCDRLPGREVLGRHTIRDTDLYSTCLAIENLWLVARAEGVGVGWVSFYRPDDLRSLLGLPEHVVPVAWLCIGYPDERPSRPGLEVAGWARRRQLDEFVHAESWGEPLPTPGAETPIASTDAEQPIESARTVSPHAHTSMGRAPLTAANGADDFINSLRGKRIEGFKQRYRNYDVLLIDDVQFFEGKERCQGGVLPHLQHALRARETDRR
jgi:hypothetical protein